MLTLLLLLSNPVEPPECDKEAADAETQLAMNLCAAREFAEADAELNAQWELTKAHLKERDQEFGVGEDTGKSLGEGVESFSQTLLDGQRAWINYRDFHCEAEAQKFWGGSIVPLIFHSCRTGLTKQRTEQLRELAMTY